MAKSTNTNVGFEKQISIAVCRLLEHIQVAKYKKVIGITKSTN